MVAKQWINLLQLVKAEYVACRRRCGIKEDGENIEAEQARVTEDDARTSFEILAWAANHVWKPLLNSMFHLLDTRLPLS